MYSQPSISTQAVERLNLKPRHFCDLLTDEPFSRSDIISLQDPMAPERFDMSNFYHVKNKISLTEGAEFRPKNDTVHFECLCR